MREYGNKRALSPVIATVILVAVAITVAVAVAYWMGGIAGQYTKFEKIEIQSVQCVKNASWASGGDAGWTITLKLKNSGTAASTLIAVFINEVEVNAYNVTTAAEGEAATDMGTAIASTETILSGQTSTIKVYIENDWGAPVTSGTTVNIKIHSAGGMDYIKLVELV